MENEQQVVGQCLWLTVDIGIMSPTVALAAIRDCVPLCDVNLVELRESAGQQVAGLPDPPKDLATELAEVINRRSLESDSNTPDFILASYLADCLGTWKKHVVQRDKWYRAGGYEVSALPTNP